MSHQHEDEHHRQEEDGQQDQPRSYKPVSQMTPEEIAAEARKILLSSSSPLSGRNSGRNMSKAGDEDTADTNHAAGLDNSYSYGGGSGHSSARSALKKSGLMTPRDTFGDDSRMDDETNEDDGALSHTQRSSARRRVVVTDDKQYAEDRVELIDLPLSLALLYQAAYTVQVRHPCENLKKVLLDVALINGGRRIAEEAEAERLRNDACYRLYANSEVQREKMQKKREQLRKELAVDENTECTFKPVLSKHAQDVRRSYHTPSGKVDFAELAKQSAEWIEKREKKLKAKAVKNEEDLDESIKESKIPMSDKSKKLAEQYRAKQEEKRALESALLELCNSQQQNNNNSQYRPHVNNSASMASRNEMSPIGAASPNANRSMGAATVMEGNHNNNGDGGEDHYGGTDHDTSAPIRYTDHSSSIARYMDPANTTTTGASSVGGGGGSVDRKLLDKMQTYRRSVLDDRSNAMYYPSFEPVTNAAGAFDRYFKAGGGSPSRHHPNSPSRGGGNGGDLQNTTTSTPGRSGDGFDDGQTAANARIVQRLLDDVEQRKVRQQERLKEAEERKKEKLFDPLTGQPFFQPNAVPTIVIGRKRVPVSELPPKEREEAVKILRQKKLDFLLTVAKRKESDGSPQRDINAFLKYCDEMQAQAARRVEKIRRLEDKELEGLFVPAVDAQSKKMMQHKAAEKVYNRELPRKAAPSPPPPKRESDGEAIKNMMERSKQWDDRRKMLTNKKVNEQAKEEMRECSFNPKLRSKISAEMTAAAEQRLAGELAMLRRQQEEILRLEKEEAQRRLASQSVRSVERASVRSAQSQRSQLLENGGGSGANYGSAARRERVEQPAVFAAQRHDPSSPQQQFTAAVGGASPEEYGRVVESRSRSEATPSGHNTSRSQHNAGNKNDYNVPAAATQPLQQPKTVAAKEEPSIDDLIDSWKELDELTDTILRSGSSVPA